MKKFNIALLVLHLVTANLSVVNAVNADNNVGLVCWIIAAVCWGVCSVLDIVELSN